MKQVTDNDDVMLISDGGTIIRMHCTDISHIGRNTKGVRLMRLRDGAVATVALTARDEDEAAEEMLEAAPELPETAGSEIAEPSLSLDNDAEDIIDDSGDLEEIDTVDTIHGIQTEEDIPEDLEEEPETAEDTTDEE